jgi:hypothetical protein
MEIANYRPCPHRLKQNTTFKNGNGETLNLETSAVMFTRQLSWILKCDTFVPFRENRRMVSE